MKTRKLCRSLVIMLVAASCSLIGFLPLSTHAQSSDIIVWVATDVTAQSHCVAGLSKVNPDGTTTVLHTVDCKAKSIVTWQRIFLTQAVSHHLSYLSLDASTADWDRFIRQNGPQSDIDMGGLRPDDPCTGTLDAWLSGTYFGAELRGDQYYNYNSTCTTKYADTDVSTHVSGNSAWKVATNELYYTGHQGIIDDNDSSGCHALTPSRSASFGGYAIPGGASATTVFRFESNGNCQASQGVIYVGW